VSFVRRPPHQEVRKFPPGAAGEHDNHSQLRAAPEIVGTCGIFALVAAVRVALGISASEVPLEGVPLIQRRDQAARLVKVSGHRRPPDARVYGYYLRPRAEVDRRRPPPLSRARDAICFGGGRLGQHSG